MAAEWLKTMTTATPTLPRPDPLAEFNAPPVRPVDWRGAGRAVAASALLGGGLVVVAWIVYLLHSALFHPESLGFLARLVPPDAAERALTIPAGRIELPAAGLSALAYVLLIVLVGIGTRAAVALVKEGTWLLRQAAPQESAAAPGTGGSTTS